MFQKLVSHNDDIGRLVEKGYAVAFDSNHLVVRDIPYLDGDRKLQIGAIVTKLEFIDRERVTQTDHQIFFAGSIPHGLDGKPIPNLGGGPTQLTLSEASKDVVVQRSFSNKPKAMIYVRSQNRTISLIMCKPILDQTGLNPDYDYVRFKLLFLGAGI